MTLRHLLTGAVAAWRAGLPVPASDPDEARRRAEEILSRSEFERVRVRPPSSGPLPDLSRPATILAWIVVVVIAAVVVFVVIRVLRSVRRTPKLAGEDGVAVTLGERRLRSDQWLDEAERFEAVGDWKRALRARYRALVTVLVERGVVRELPGRTTGEYRAELAGSLPAATPPFSAASDLFDRAWYGDEPTGPADSERLRSLSAQVVDLARSVAPSTGERV
ncbi:MAG: DUF4129 domain-containing protein [Acidimicrobiales bacterium]